MLNAENDPSPSPDTRRYPLPGRENQHINVKTLTPEEIQMYKDCTLSGYYKTGIPFAIVCQLLSTRKKPVDPELVPKNYLFKRGTLFLANVILGSLFHTPVCYYKLVGMRAENDRKAREQGPPDLPEEVQLGGPHPPEDLGYTGDLTTPLAEPDTSFSTDFEFPRPLIDDDKLAKPRSTTYEELRAKHRRSHFSPPSSSQNFESEPGTFAPPVSSEQPSGTPRRVVKNKYGDEIE